MLSEQYLIEIKVRLLASVAVIYLTIVKQRALPKNGYFRARLTLSNGDFWEVVEYFIVDEDRCVTESYRYQWMDADCQTLRKRWDNVAHYPNLPNFPHHIHIGEESNVEPSTSISIIELIDMIESELESFS